MKSLSPAPSFSVMGSKLQRGAPFMGRLVCAGMRTKEGRKLTLECHTGDNRPGLCFQQTQPGNQGAGFSSRAWAWGSGGRRLFRGTDARAIWRFSLTKWALPCGCFFLALHFNFYNILLSVNTEKGVNLPKLKMYEYIMWKYRLEKNDFYVPTNTPLIGITHGNNFVKFPSFLNSSMPGT